MIQLAKFMIHSHRLFKKPTSDPANTEKETETTMELSSTDGRPESRGDTKRVLNHHALRHYTEPAANILGIINCSSPDHIRYVNPFVASTVWLAAAVQIVQGNIGNTSKGDAIQDSKVEILRLTHEKHVNVWDTPRTLLEGVDALDARIKSS